MRAPEPGAMIFSNFGRSLLDHLIKDKQNLTADAIDLVIMNFINLEEASLLIIG